MKIAQIRMMLRAACAISVAAFAAAAQAKEDWSRIYLANEPVLAPDGKTFYFTWNDLVWRAPVAGGTAHIVSPTSGRASTPCLSPDGRRIAFQNDCEGSSFVYECPTAGGPVRQVTFHTELTRPWCYTPDGKSLVCTVRRDHSGDKDSLRIAVLPVGRRGAEKVLFDEYGNTPSLSPDGRSLLFVRGTGSRAPFRKRRHSKTAQNGEIWLFAMASKKFRCLVEKPFDVRDPVWLPGGKSFLYLSTEQGGIRNLVRRSFADGKETVLTRFTDEHAERPSVSADGKTVVFRQGFDFWRLDLAASNAVPAKIVLHPESGYVARPAVRRRIYDRITNIDESGDATFCSEGMQCAFTASGVLWVMDTEIRQPRRVDGGAKAFVRSCAFSPDGDRLYYVADRGDGTDIRVAQRADNSRGWWENETFKIKAVVSDGAIRKRFSLSPDGKRFAWQDPNGRLSFAGTNGVVKTRGPVCADAGAYAWSPDGKWVAAAYGDINGNDDIWIVSTEGAREPYNVSRNFMWDGAPAWSPDGKILAFAGEYAPEGGERLFYVYLSKADEERETFDKRYEDARKKVSGSDSPKLLQRPKLSTNMTVKVSQDVAPTNQTAKVAQGTAATNQTAKATQRTASTNQTVKAQSPKPSPVKIDFDGLYERVRMVSGVQVSSPYFSHDSRTIAFSSGGKTMKVHVPDRLTPQKAFDKVGSFCAWIAKGDRALRIVNGHPAHGDAEFSFRAYDEVNVADWQELGFKTAWARIRDRFYDDGFHGADWNAMKGRYLDAARNATSHATFRAVVEMMLGELDASHLALRPTSESMREWGFSPVRATGWQQSTAHLGLRFDPSWKGKGWKVRDVVKGGPADLSSFDFKAGDVVLAVDGVKVNPGDDPTVALNGPAGREVTLTMAPRPSKKPGAKEVQVRMKTTSFEAVRANVGAEKLRATREYVHSKSGGKLGYLNIESMDMKSFWLFQKEVFSEGYGREGLIIDVRDNGGGSTADKVLSVLVGANHALVHSRGFGHAETGYPLYRWERPLWYRPIVVMCNEDSASNAEILTHAVKALKRGRVVGMPTGGNVISTWGRSLLDLGMLRDPHRGWYTPDGTDMEWHGAVPDVIVKNSPTDLVRGVDAQLNVAIKTLSEDVAKAKGKSSPVTCRPAR